MSKVYLISYVPGHYLVYRYIQIWANLRHTFMDGGSTISEIIALYKHTRSVLSAERTICCHSVIAEYGGHIGLWHMDLQFSSLT
jgi:hypothetical protein